MSVGIYAFISSSLSFWKASTISVIWMKYYAGKYKQYQLIEEIDKDLSRRFEATKRYFIIRNLCNCSTCSFLLHFSSCLLQSEDASIITSVLSGYEVIEEKTLF